jgi:hypothetical protein
LCRALCFVLGRRAPFYACNVKSTKHHIHLLIIFLMPINPSPTVNLKNDPPDPARRGLCGLLCLASPGLSPRNRIRSFPYANVCIYITIEASWNLNIQHSSCNTYFDTATTPANKYGRFKYLLGVTDTSPPLVLVTSPLNGSNSQLLQADRVAGPWPVNLNVGGRRRTRR